MTAEEGIIKATVFGGSKSKLRSHAAPYNSGKVWIYRDPAKDYGKLSDFDVQSWRPGLRELYERTMAACGVAETILATHGGGGDWEKVLSMSAETLDALENASEELCERLLVHFLWRWAGLLGIQPQIECCSVCGKETESVPLLYSSRENTVLCVRCVSEARLRPKNNGLTELNPGCRRWLSAIGQLNAAGLYRYSMDNKSLNEAKSLSKAVLTGALGKRLASWDW
jgi:DNA repair protein RecO (recombination protein O)